MQVEKYEGFFEKSYYGSTFLHPLAAFALVSLGLLTIALPRKWALVPLMVLTNFVPCSQRIAIFGLDFNLLRLIVMFGLLRVLIKGELFAVKINLMDKLFIGWAISVTVLRTMQHRSPGMLVTMCGTMLEGAGGYIVVRCLIRSWDDVIALAKGVAVIAIPVGIFFFIEKNTGRNYFSIFGGVGKYTIKREGKLRAMGAISNPITAGCYWAALVPMMAALYWQKGMKALAVLGTLGGLVVVYACASSTPLAAMMAAFLGAYLFKYRYHLGDIRKGVIYVLIVLHILKTMRGKPVWHLLSSIDLVGGSTGWHRYFLIDECIKRVHEWFVWGVKYTGHWGWGLWDITNQYVYEATRGGMLTLCFFVAEIFFAFKALGLIWRTFEDDRPRLAMAWGVGVSLFVHCCSFIAVSYFGQMVIGWYLTIALIGSVYGVYLDGTEGAREAGEKPSLRLAVAPVPRRRRRRRLLGAV